MIGASGLAALPLTSEPTTTPNPSIPITATAAARGAPSHASNRPAFGSSRSAAIAPPAKTRCPRSMTRPMSWDMCGGSEPRRVPHSTQ
jgi:hypothetical protein